MQEENKIRFKAIGCFIFGGSQTIGHMQAGWEVDRVLEMTENMKEANSAHFVKNYPNIPIVLPSEWSSEGYLEALYGKYDLFFANNPCSGLSMINRRASADNPTNNHFYEVFDIIKKIEPKIFLLENAPTLVLYGTPVLKKMTTIIGDSYRFTIIRDKSSNHNVCMPRMRTFVIGWNRKYFDKIPLIHMNLEKSITLMDVIGKSLDGIANCEADSKKTAYRDCVHLYKYMLPGETLFRTSVRAYNEIKDEFSERWRKLVDHDIAKLEKKRKAMIGAGNIWDKSPYKTKANTTAPGLTSLTYLVHPIEDRDFYVREYARMMGYPDDFIFYPEDSIVSCVQACAQGVPVNFIKYISKELRRLFEEHETTGKFTEEVLLDDGSVPELVFQNHLLKHRIGYTLEQFRNLNGDLITSYNVKTAVKLTI